MHSFRSAMSLFVLAMFGLGIVGCGNGSRTSTKTTEATTVEAQQLLMNAEDFDLATVTELVKSNQFKDMAGLEEYINNMESGINNVDIDGDGQIDYVGVNETQEGGKYNIAFVAYPSSEDGQNETTIAQLAISQSTTSEEVTISGGYPDYVGGYDSHYYSSSYHRRGMSFGDALFLSYMFSSRPMYVQRPYRSIGYRSAPIRSGSQLRSTRSSAQTRARVSPTRSTSRPSTYKVQGSDRTRSRMSSGKQKPQGSSLSTRSGSQRDFQRRDTSNASQTGAATGFGGTSKSKSNGTGSSTTSGTRSGTSSGSSSSSSSSSRTAPQRPASRPASSSSSSSSSSRSKSGSSSSSSKPKPKSSSSKPKSKPKSSSRSSGSRRRGRR